MKRVSVALATAAGLAVVASAAGVATGATLLRISSDPFTNTTSMHRTEVEPDTFAFGSTIVATFQTGRFFSGGSSDIGWATSRNGGASWTHGFLPGITLYTNPPGSFPRVSDPSVAFDAKHGVWIISSIPLTATATPNSTTSPRATWST